MTKSECAGLFKFLGDHVAIPPGCKHSLANPEGSKVSADENVHRNSWLWPTLARRATGRGDKKHPNHPNNWEPDVLITVEGCAELKKALAKALGSRTAEQILPDGCKAIIT